MNHRLPNLPWCSLIAVAALGVLGVPATGHGHARLTQPYPRDSSPAHKDPFGPCGVMRRDTDLVAYYTVGQRIEVKWQEVINHPGCFLISLSKADDKDFQLLANVKHNGMPPQPTDLNPREYSAMVDLPAGVTCDKCTLQLRQIMLANEVTTCPPDPLPAGDTYYSCADVRIDTVLPDLGPPDLTPGRDLARAPSPPDMAVAPGLEPAMTTGGCTLGGTPGNTASAWVGLLALPFLLRRRRRIPG